MDDTFFGLRIRTWVKVIGIPILLLILFALFKPWGYVENYELGYKFSALDGKITVLNRPGYHRRVPWVDTINTVDLRPTQVCINANSRVLNCKLVKFNPDKEHNYQGLMTFLAWHGRGNYSISTSSSQNDQSSGGLSDILKSYAYDGNARSYPFLTILRELRADEPLPVVAVATPTSAPPVAKP
jgi:hypothetical protein